MKKIILALLISLISVNAFAATYHVRLGGGTSTQCTGLSAADYSGSGTAQACGFNHPSWALGGGVAGSATAAKMTAADTLQFDDDGPYMIGYGMPNTLNCSASSPQSCVINGPPSGTSINALTKIYGQKQATGCATKTVLWGTQGVYYVLGLYGKSNLDIECLEITDHSNCTYGQGANQCNTSFPNSGTFAKNGIETNSVTNLTLKNIDIEGIPKVGLFAADFSGVTAISHVNIDGAGFTGWDGDDSQIGGTANFNFGTMTMDQVKIRFSGCQQAYPHSAAFTVSDYGNCNSQSNGGQGDGLALYGTAGTINMTNIEFSHNTQDGFDGLHLNGNDTINADKILSEGNAGNQFKFTLKNFNLTNSVIIANCTYLKASGKVYNTSNFDECRADGGPMSASSGAPGGAWKFINDTVYTSFASSGSPVIEVVQGGLSNGTESYTYKNNIFVSNNSATNWTPFYSNLSGAVATPFNNPTNDHNRIYHFTNNPAGTGNVFTAPSWVGTVGATTTSNVSSVFLTANAGGGASTTYWRNSNDYNNFPQNASIDMGAIQYGSSIVLAQAGQVCTSTADCAAGTCSNFTCTGSCTNNGGACATGATCCSGNCSASVCAIPATCGDNVIQPGEVCDGTALGNQTCTTQGFTGGSITCASNCLSYVTSSCTNTTLFPLTPILDSFTRANSTGLGSSSWVTLDGSFNISSNAALPISGSGASNFAYWAASSFGADEEAYVTISNKGSNGDSVVVYTRHDPVNYKGYKVEVAPSTNHIFIQRIDPAEVQLGATITQAISTGDSIGMSVVGSTITAWYKASAGSWTSLGTRTDTTYTAGGSVAINVATGGGATPDIKLTNFGGGSLNPVTCGNGLKEVGEICDGADLAGQSCLTQGFATGTLTCAPNCQNYVTSSCTTASVCGNNTKETGEVCDGIDINSQTCVGLGYASGTLGCLSSCLAYNTGSCVTSVTSGVSGGITLK